jgi:hypothetical protein
MGVNDLGGADDFPWWAYSGGNPYQPQGQPNQPTPTGPMNLPPGVYGPGQPSNPALALQRLKALFGGGANAATIPNGQLSAAPPPGNITAGLPTGPNYGAAGYAMPPWIPPGAGGPAMGPQGPAIGSPAPAMPLAGLGRPPAGPLASGGTQIAGTAQSQPAGSPGPPGGNRAGMWDWQVPGMGRGGQLPITAANWSGLFNRGQPAIGSPAPAQPPARPQGPMGQGWFQGQGYGIPRRYAGGGAAAFPVGYS